MSASLFIMYILFLSISLIFFRYSRKWMCSCLVQDLSTFLPSMIDIFHPWPTLCSPPYLSIALIILYYQMRITRQIFDSCSVMREGFPIGQWIRYWFGIKLGLCGVKLGWCNNKTLIRIKERSLRFTKKKGGYIAFFSQVGDVGPKMHKTMWTSHLRLLYQPQLAVLTCGTIERERIERRLSKASSLTSSFRERQSFNAAVKGPSPWLKVKIHQLKETCNELGA